MIFSLSSFLIDLVVGVFLGWLVLGMWCILTISSKASTYEEANQK